ncbi:uncharacterized protein LOC110744746 [Prunus avium]|uniref:Uncharacterized protein LOC110744746 n=1 Tax=Prunus avium TaxID=42229 RepID=A0A6P5RBW1_PRUAV|nr:uncharacterized protein LOC110744746 [Prunus avium]
MDPNANLPHFVMTPINVVCRGMAYPVLLIPITIRIIDLKQLIWQVFQVPILPERQELSCGQLLRDELTPQDYDIPPNAIIHVLVKIHVRICLSSQGPYYDYVVHEGTTMGNLKARLHADHGVVIENKVLRMNTTDHDDRTQLWAAGAVEGTELYLDDPRPRGRGRPRRGG